MSALSSSAVAFTSTPPLLLADLATAAQPGVELADSPHIDHSLASADRLPCPCLDAPHQRREALGDFVTFCLQQRIATV